jgi:hypothetical protein
MFRAKSSVFMSKLSMTYQLSKMIGWNFYQMLVTLAFLFPEIFIEISSTVYKIVFGGFSLNIVAVATKTKSLDYRFLRTTLSSSLVETFSHYFLLKFLENKNNFKICIASFESPPICGKILQPSLIEVSAYTSKNNCYCIFHIWLDDNSLVYVILVFILN